MSKRRQPLRTDVGIRHLHRTTCVQVARVDWVAVTTGAKRELRKYGHGGLAPLVFPRPCVLYTPHPTLGGPPTTRLGVLEEQWNEPLGAISPESLEREGYRDDYDGFREYFAARYPKGGFRPLAKVLVQRVHPMDDVEPWREWVWQLLYGQAVE